MISISEPWSWWLIVGAQVTVELLAEVGILAPVPYPADVDIEAADTLTPHIFEPVERAALAFKAAVSSICNSSQCTFSKATWEKGN